jgi:hypothetical protein
VQASSVKAARTAQRLGWKPTLLYCRYPPNILEEEFSHISVLTGLKELGARSPRGKEAAAFYPGLLRLAWNYVAFRSSFSFLLV